MQSKFYNPFFNRRKECPFCNSREFINLFDLPYSNKDLSSYLTSFYSDQGSIELDYLNGVHYSLCKCQACEGIFQEFIPNDFLMEKLYEEWISPEKTLAAHAEKERNTSLILNYQREINTITEAFFKAKKDVKVLDFGMGWGTWAHTAKDLGCEVYGTELSKSRIAYAKEQGIEILNLGDSVEKFDFINTEQVFEHLPDPLTTLKMLTQRIKKNGIIKISVPTARNIEERLKKIDWDAPKFSKKSINPVAPLEHVNFFRKKTILKMAHLTGLEEIKISMIIQYKNIKWSGNLKHLIKKSIKPIRHNYLNHYNYIFLKTQQTSTDQYI